MFKECGRRTTDDDDDDDDDGRTDNGACIYYKLTYEPKGSGELIIHFTEYVAYTSLQF